MCFLPAYEGGLQPSRRRSLFTLASSMLIFSARAGSLPELIPVVKESLTDKTVNTYTYPSDYYTHTHITFGTFVFC
jgi:hypothetical protein